MPDVTNVQVQIITAAPALSPVEVEQYVTRAGRARAWPAFPRATEVRSISKYGLSVVTVVFEDDTDIYFARQLVNERMREAQDAVPAQYGKPEMGPITTGLGEIYQFVVRNDRAHADAARGAARLVDRAAAAHGARRRRGQQLRRRGQAVPGLLDPKRLQAAGLSVAQVVDALEKSNANAGGGYIEHNREHFVIGTDGLVKSLDDLQRVVIGATPQGVPDHRRDRRRRASSGRACGAAPRRRTARARSSSASR